MAGMNQRTFLGWRNPGVPKVSDGKPPTAAKAQSVSDSVAYINVMFISAAALLSLLELALAIVLIAETHGGI